VNYYNNRTILITGASGGLGAVAAEILAPFDTTLLLTARSEGALADVAKKCQAAGARTAIFPLDLSLPGAAHDLYDQVMAQGYEVDVLVNNAGFGKVGPLHKGDPHLYEQMITLNVTNLVTLARLVLPRMVERGSGGVLNVSSRVAFQPVTNFAVYSASKAFVLSFSEALHEEMRPHGVHVSCLCPGSTRTEFHNTAAISERSRNVMGIADPEPVMKAGLNALAKNDRVYVPGYLNTVAAVAARVLPNKISLIASRRMFADE
jgi:uncharacterized protein